MPQQAQKVLTESQEIYTDIICNPFTQRRNEVCILRKNAVC